MASDFEELSRRAEEKTANLVKKSAAVTSGTIRGIRSTIPRIPRWLKIVLIIAAIWIVLAILVSLSEQPSHY